jgi:mRNA-degrading endonuclease RelE of RelBE toxin-antitoxin system
MEFAIDLSPDAQSHLDDFTARERRTVLDAIDVRLRHEPLVWTRNRKPLDPNDLATWELRVGQLRVFYDVETEPQPIVWIRAIGRKIGNRLYLGGKELEL